MTDSSTIIKEGTYKKDIEVFALFQRSDEFKCNDTSKRWHFFKWMEIK